VDTAVSTAASAAISPASGASAVDTTAAVSAAISPAAASSLAGVSMDNAVFAGVTMGSTNERPPPSRRADTETAARTRQQTVEE